MLHAMLLDDMSAGEAQKRSFSLMKEHWKDFLKRFAVIIGYSALILSAAYLLIKILPQLFVEYKGKDLPSGCVIDLFENSIHELTETGRVCSGIPDCGRSFHRSGRLPERRRHLSCVKQYHHAADKALLHLYKQAGSAGSPRIKKKIPLPDCRFHRTAGSDRRRRRCARHVF